MFALLFGWSKASKCKKAIKRARSRLRLLKNKRQAISRQLRKDLAELIQNGHEEVAINRVEQLMQDESLAAAYELLDHFCEFILTQLSYIRRHKDCPNDINEAVSSLIFASARCGDLPELFSIRKLFRERYGQKFATTALELYPGNLVNKQLKENLSGKSVPDDLKYRVVDEIARDHCLQQQVLAIQYYPNWQQMKVKENKGYQLVESDAQKIDTIAGSKVHPSEIEDVKCVHLSISNPSDSCYQPESNASAIVSTVQKYPPYTVSSPLQKKVGTLEIVDYVEDIEECQLSVAKDGTCQDQTLFKFRSCGFPMREKAEFGYDKSHIDQGESQNEKSSMRISSRSKRAPETRSRRRSTSLENQCIRDIGYMKYYQKPCRKHQKKPSLEEGEIFSFEMSGCCSLDKPCYFGLYGDHKNCSEARSVKPKRETRATTHVQQGGLLDECCHELSNGMELVAISQRPNNKHLVLNNHTNEMEAVISTSHKVYNPRTTTGFVDSLTRMETEAPYSRAMTMPQERRGNGEDKMLRTYSCPTEHPNHVHPKLPDYDDIAAKFIALKRDQQRK
ncbi:uncharacterized protein LOC130746775 [Lotus japonicus]|uniref:uncharacterized protein LOC130746775 n=1 Tax=Lotus japonicus TaxID=34305 RepID=UPI00258F8A9B|nr:uncharacterized protein LOC130746775 [Lotus japonicus]